MAKPFVSICCITFNQERYIQKCLDGFIDQKTDFDFEILIHDDASTDKTADIIREYELKYPKLFKPIYQVENQFSKGIKPINKFNFSRAIGKYIAMCEGDDYWTDPYKLQKEVDFLEKNKDYGLVHTNYNKFYEASKKLIKHQPENYSRIDENSYYLKTGDLRTCTVLFRKEYIPEINDLFSQKFMKDAVIGDRPIFTLIASKSKIHFIDEVTSVYRISASNSASHFNNIYKYYEFLLKVTILNENLFDYLNLDYDKKELLANRKFYKIVLESKSSLIKSMGLLIISGLRWSYYKEFKTIFLNKIKK